MDLKTKLAILAETAERLGVETRHIPLGGSAGGLCTIRGRNVIIIDSTADRASQIDAILSSFAQMPEIDNAYVEPWIREAVDEVRRREAED